MALSMRQGQVWGKTTAYLLCQAMSQQKQEGWLRRKGLGAYRGKRGHSSQRSKGSHWAGLKMVSRTYMWRLPPLSKFSIYNYNHTLKSINPIPSLPSRLTKSPALIMLFQMSDGKGQQQTLEIESYHIKTYTPSTCLEQLSYMLIRPPRVLYNEDLLLPFREYGKRYKYSVYYIPFPLSVYEPKEMDYLLLYLHGNSSSRLQGFMEVDNLPPRVGLACFDFDGCGNRLQREFISLGKEEAREVDVAAEYLMEKGHVVVGWGRSMGSVSLLLSSKCKIVVADSPFSSLKRLCKENMESHAPRGCKSIFSCMFSCFFCILDGEIKRKADMSINDLETIDLINKNKDRSIIFLAGTSDELISASHTQRLHSRFEGRKKMILFQGDHGSQRPIDILAQTHTWIKQQIQFLIKSRQQNLNVQQRPQQNNKSLSQLLKETIDPTDTNMGSSTEKIIMSEHKQQLQPIEKSNQPSDRSDNFN